MVLVEELGALFLRQLEESDNPALFSYYTFAILLSGYVENWYFGTPFA